MTESGGLTGEPPRFVAPEAPGEWGPSAPRLRIAFFTDSYTPTLDGVAQVTATLARALGRQGHSVTIFTVRTPGLSRTERGSAGLEVRRFRSVPAPRYRQYRVALTPWSLLLGSRSEFDVAHLHTPGFVGLAGWLAARRWRVPTVATYHTNLPDLLRGSGSNSASRAFFRAWSRFSLDLCRHSDLATAPSESARSALLPPPTGPGSREPRCVPNGVDTERFRPGVGTPDWRERLGARGALLITFLGRLTRDKGAARFLDAVERLAAPSPWLALIGGVGPEGTGLEARVRDTPLLSRHIRILGPVSEEEKPGLLSQSSVFVLPSLSDTSSVALLEAMASGAACVVTSRGGPAEIARRSECGLVVDPEDPDALARAIERLLADPTLRSSFAGRGRSWVVANASAERMAMEFVRCYRDVIGSDPSRLLGFANGPRAGSEGSATESPGSRDGRAPRGPQPG